MANGITGTILKAQSVTDIKTINVIFESKGVKYEISDLCLIFSGIHQNKSRMYCHGKCIHDNVEYKQVSLNIFFSQDFPITYHIAIEDFINQEANLFLA